MRLSRLWECQLIVRKRIHDEKHWIREPAIPMKKSMADGVEEEQDEGPPINHEFMKYNTAILHSMFKCWGLTPKPTIDKLTREVWVQSKTTCCMCFPTTFNHP